MKRAALDRARANTPPTEATTLYSCRNALRYRPERSFDLVWCSETLEHIPDVADTLGEIRRVLRPGGRFVFVEHVAAPHGTGLRCAQRALGPMWRVFSDGCHPDRDTGRLIEAAGFANVDLTPFTLPVPIMGPHIAGVART